MKQLESFALAEICFCLTAFENIRILPGINLIPENLFEQLTKHPSFKDYTKSGILEEIHIDESEFKIDAETNITILDTEEEKIPIQNILINSKSAPLAQNGIFINPGVAKKAGLPQEIANRIGQFAPPTGWISAQQIKEKLDLSDDIDLSRLPFPKLESEAE